MSVLSATRFRGWSGHDWEDEDDRRHDGRGDHGGGWHGNIRPPRVVADTGDQIERIAAANGALASGRADDRGPEPEGITVFRAGWRELAAVTLERSDGVVIFDVSNPRHPQAIAFVPTGDAPEATVYLRSRRVLIATNEDDATITLICVRMGEGGCR